MSDGSGDPWVIRRHEEYERRQKRYTKKHPKELVAVLDNLDTYMKTLNNGVKPLQIRFGFTHDEPLGVVAIDQKGGGPNLAETRLYVYPDIVARELHLLTIGDQWTQKDAIQFCKSFITKLRGKAERDHGRQKDVQ